MLARSRSISAIAAFLVLRQLERKRGAVALDQVSRLGQRRRDLLLTLGRPSRERELEDEQLVERKPAPALLRLVERTWPVQRGERISAERQPALCFQGGRQRVGAVGGEREHRLDELAELHGRDLLAGRIDRCEVRGRRAPVQVEGANRKAEAVRRSAEAYVRAGRQLVLEPRLVEPGRRDLAAAVGHLGGEDLEPSAASPERRAPHLALDQDLLVPEQIGDPLLRRRLLVAARAVVEQVAYTLEPELCETLLQGRPDAGERVDRRLETLWAEAAARGRPALGRVHVGETGQGPVHRPSIAAGPAGPDVPGVALAVRRPVEQYGGTGRRLERRERREPAPEAGSAGREAQAARDVRSAGTRRSRVCPGRHGCRPRRRES